MAEQPATTAWSVTWRRKPIAGEFLIDVDAPEMAAEIAIRLHDYPRVYDVRVNALEKDIDPAVKARIWARIKERIDHDWATKVMTA